MYQDLKDLMRNVYSAGTVRHGGFGNIRTLNDFMFALICSNINGTLLGEVDYIILSTPKLTTDLYRAIVDCTEVTLSTNNFSRDEELVNHPLSNEMNFSFFVSGLTFHVVTTDNAPCSLIAPFEEPMPEYCAVVFYDEEEISKYREWADEDLTVIQTGGRRRGRRRGRYGINIDLSYENNIT